MAAPLEGVARLESDGVREASRQRLLFALVRNLQSRTAEAEPHAEKVVKIARSIEAREAELFRSRQP